MFAAFGRAAHHAKQARPINLRGTFELSRPRVAQAGNVGDKQDITGFIKAAAAGAAEHLQEFIRLHMTLKISRHVGGPSDENGAHGKVNPRRQTHRRHDHVELSRLGQGLDQAGAHRVAQSTVMIGDAAAQKFREAFARERFLRGGERERVANCHGGRNRLRHFFARVSAWREDENRCELGAERASDHARPKTFCLDELRIGKIAQVHFFERNGAFLV